MDGAVRTHTSFINQVHCLIWVQFAAPPNNHNAAIRDHGSQITITNKIVSLKYYENYQNVSQRHKVSQLWKNGTNTELTQGCHKSSIYLKTNAVSVKHKKQSSIK